MSSGRIRAITGALAPSAVLLAIAILGLFFDTYWQYVFAISITAAVIGSALAMLVGYARCITIATGAMLAIGAYGATIPVVHGSMPFLAAVVTATLLGACAGWMLAVPGVRFRSHNLALITLVFQAVVIIVLRESKTLTGGAEGMHVPPPLILATSSSPLLLQGRDLAQPLLHVTLAKLAQARARCRPDELGGLGFAHG